MTYVRNEILKTRFLKKKTCDFENAIFMKNGLLKCDFCEKCYFENAIFVENCDFKNVKFWIKYGFSPQCALKCTFIAKALFSTTFQLKQ